jgi:hypothetical protein
MTHSYEMSRYASSHISLVMDRDGYGFYAGLFLAGALSSQDLDRVAFWHELPRALTSRIGRYPILNGLSPKSERGTLTHARELRRTIIPSAATAVPPRTAAATRCRRLRLAVIIRRKALTALVFLPVIRFDSRPPPK